MKALTVIGIVLIAVGAFLLIRPEGFTTKRDVLAVGSLKVTAEEQHPVSPLLAGGVLAIGLGLVVFGVGAGRKA
jgi:hypothetical protein